MEKLKKFKDEADEEKQRFVTNIEMKKNWNVSSWKDLDLK